MLNWLTKRKLEVTTPIVTDIHSHLLPGLDDGVKTFEESASIIVYLQRLGYQKLITTPHVMSDAYRNSAQDILQKLEELKKHLHNHNIDVNISAAAEYYLDEQLFRMIERDDVLLTFGSKYLLFETNFMTEPLNLKEFIFMATTKGYKLVLAHPERYLYLQNNFAKIQDLLDRGVLFQLNISSITGHYSKQVQKLANILIDKKCVHWLGSDIHHAQQAELIAEARKFKYFHKALHLPLLNNTLT